MKLFQLAEKLDVDQCDLSGSHFSDVKLAGASFVNADMSGWRVEDVTLAGSAISNANLSGLEIKDCGLDGMTIEGVLVSEMMRVYRESKGAK